MNNGPRDQEQVGALARELASRATKCGADERFCPICATPIHFRNLTYHIISSHRDELLARLRRKTEGGSK
jgi:hypothetical protein